MGPIGHFSDNNGIMRWEHHAADPIEQVGGGALVLLPQVRQVAEPAFEDHGVVAAGALFARVLLILEGCKPRYHLTKS